MGTCRKGTHMRLPEEMTNTASQKEAGVIQKASESETGIEQQEKNGYRESRKRIPDIGNI